MDCRASALLLVPCCLALLGCPGCGLLFLPTVETFPDPVRRVSVVDAATDAPLSSASVQVEVVSVSTKTGLFDTHGTNGSENGDPVRLKVSCDGHGSFTPRGTWHLAWWQCLWPLFSWATPGDWQYYGHSNQIAASAPGHEPITIQYAAWTDARGFSEGLVSLDGGTLTLRLKPSQAPP